MSGQSLDLRSSTQIVRRYRVLVGIVALLGLLGGIGYAVLAPPLVTSSALVVLPVSTREIATEVVVAHSDPVLSAALPQAGSGWSLTTLRTHVQAKSLTGNVISISARSQTGTQARDAANAVAASFVSYVTGGHSAVGKLQAKLLAPAQDVTGSSTLTHLAVDGLLGLLAGALVGAIAALALGRGDRRLRERDELADAIGVPVVASVSVGHPSDPAGWTKLIEQYEPGAIHAWNLRRALNQLGLVDLDLQGPNGPDARDGYSLAVLSLAADRGALALGPQLAAYTAALGIPTVLVIGPQQDENVTASLRAAAVALAGRGPGSSRPGELRVAVGDGYDVRQAPGELAVIVGVVDGQAPQVTDTMRATVTVFGVSAGAATAEQLARVAVSAAADRRDIAGIIVADPDPADHTTGRLSQPARPARRRQPARFTGTTTETRR
jgi:capsular polysaccharide biosynthesis protein